MFLERRTLQKEDEREHAEHDAAEHTELVHVAEQAISAKGTSGWNSFRSDSPRSIARTST
jgi:hypothetical protein